VIVSKMLGKIFFSLLVLLALLVSLSCKKDDSDVLLMFPSNESTPSQTTNTETQVKEEVVQTTVATITEPEINASSSATQELYVGLAQIEALEKPTSLEERFSYTYGFLVMDAAFRDLEEIDSEYFIKGILDFTLDNTPFFTKEQMSAILFEYNDKLVSEAASRLAEFSERNLKEAEQFLELNTMREQVVTTSSGLQYEVLRGAEGKKPGATDTVRVNYQLMYLDGRVGEASPKGNPSTFTLSTLIDGFKEGLMLMPVGSAYRFWVHPKLGYGERGSVQVEPNSLLIFDVELVEIVD